MPSTEVLPTENAMPILRVLSAAAVREALPMNEAIAAMRQAFGQLSDGTAALPLRTSIPVPEAEGVALMMSARCNIPHGLGGKLVTVFPRNPAAGRPLVHAAVVLLAIETGEPVALLEGTALTALRTGAASGLATELLARKDAARVAIIGTGVQARTQLEAVCCVRPVKSVAVYSPDREGAARYAEEMAAVSGVPPDIRLTESVRDAVRDADVVCAATSSRTPVLTTDDVSPGVHINAVGSFTPEMQEIDPALVGGVRVVVDQRDASLAEAGEVIAAVDGGLLAAGDLTELGEIVNGTAPGRSSPSEMTLFKSVGVAVQDLCAGSRAVERAKREGIGEVVDL
jgi:ornithine cyclodeaminase